jgi:predicted small secreted protein
MQTQRGEKIMKRFIAGILFVVCAAALVGCETVKGAGRDIQGGGQNIQKAAS